MIVTVKAGGIPCQAEVDITGGPCTWDPWTPDPGWEFSYKLLDLRGRPAPWLDEVVSRGGDLAREALEASIIDAIEGEYERDY